MFSLIITIISIALVTALALAIIYYWGGVFRQEADNARVRKKRAYGHTACAYAHLV